MYVVANVDSSACTCSACAVAAPVGMLFFTEILNFVHEADVILLTCRQLFVNFVSSSPYTI